MESEERKKKFVALLETLLKDCDYIQSNLAKKLEVSPSSLTRWLQGKIDPSGLETSVFARIARIVNLPIDSLVKDLEILRSESESREASDRFAKFVEEMLVAQSQEQLGTRLGVSQKTVSNWINTESKIDPGKLPISTIARLARERGWAVDKLLAYLGLQKPKAFNEDLLTQIEILTLQLSFPDLVKLQAWFAREFESKLKKLDREILIKNQSKISSSLCVAILLDRDDLLIASNYSSNLVRHLEIEPENITIATIQNLPDSLEDVDVLIFDVSNADSPSIALIQDLNFDGDIVVFSAIELPSAIRSAIAPFVTDLVLKPIDWQQLKNKPYFQ